MCLVHEVHLGNLGDELSFVWTLTMGEKVVFFSSWDEFRARLPRRWKSSPAWLLSLILVTICLMKPGKYEAFQIESQLQFLENKCQCEHHHKAWSMCVHKEIVVLWSRDIRNNDECVKFPKLFLTPHLQLQSIATLLSNTKKDFLSCRYLRRR